MKNAAHPVGCVAKNGGNAPEKSTLILEFHCTMGQPYLSIAAKDNLQKPWAFGGEWYARLDSNQRPLESELSSRQAGSPAAQGLGWCYTDFRHFEEKPRKPCGARAPGVFVIVVK